MNINPRVVKAYGTLFLTPLGDLKTEEGIPVAKYIKSEEERVNELQEVLIVRDGYEEEIEKYIILNG